MDVQQASRMHVLEIKKLDAMRDQTKDNSMNLLLCATKDYVIHAFELLVSLRMYSKKHFNVFMIIDTNDTGKYQQFFEKHVIEDASFTFYTSKLLDSCLSGKFSLDLSKMTYARLVAFKMLPLFVSKILYLDLDMLVMNDGIDEFYDKDFNDHLAIVCEEISVELFAKTELDNCKVSRYFNAGIMLCNLDKIRQAGIDDQCIQILKEAPENVIFKGSTCDQTVLNYLFHEDVVFADPKYNVQAILVGYPQYTEYARSWGAYTDQFDLFSKCVVMHMQGEKPYDTQKYLSWQSWQIPLKKWQFYYYQCIVNLIELKYKNVYVDASSLQHFKT